MTETVAKGQDWQLNGPHDTEFLDMTEACKRAGGEYRSCRKQDILEGLSRELGNKNSVINMMALLASW